VKPNRKALFCIFRKPRRTRFWRCPVTVHYIRWTLTMLSRRCTHAAADDRGARPRVAFHLTKPINTSSTEGERTCHAPSHLISSHRPTDRPIGRPAGRPYAERPMKSRPEPRRINRSVALCRHGRADRLRRPRGSEKASQLSWIVTPNGMARTRRYRLVADRPFSSSIRYMTSLWRHCPSVHCFFWAGGPNREMREWRLMRRSHFCRCIISATSMSSFCWVFSNVQFTFNIDETSTTFRQFIKYKRRCCRYYYIISLYDHIVGYMFRILLTESENCYIGT